MPSRDEIVRSPLRPHRFNVYRRTAPGKLAYAYAIWDLQRHRPVRRVEAATHTHVNLADDFPFMSDAQSARNVAAAMEEAHRAAV
ncbi:MAG: hypothetical protein ACRDNM_06205 [Gaiellaceae bacterium]